MGLLRRKPSAGERAAEATREAAVTTSEHLQEAVGTTTEQLQEARDTAAERVREVADESRRRADAAAEKLSKRAEKARVKAENAGKRADRATRKAGKRAAVAGKQARKAASGAVDRAGSVSEASLKNDRKIAAARAKADVKARKAEAKAQNTATKAQLKSEEAALKQAEKERQAREWNAAKAKRYISVGKVVAPVLAPYAMAAAGTLRHRWDDHRSRRLGVSPDELGGYSGRGGQLHARISRIARSFDELESDGGTGRNSDAERFVSVNRPRLNDFAAAVRAAEQMPAPRRKAAYRAVSADLDRIEVDLLSYLGVRA